jgi:secreted PhoX family phosphatase
MPNGTIGYDTLASSTVGGADVTTYFTSVVNNTLVNGLNVIAVELHQQGTTSSDLSFDMEVRGKLPPLATASYPIMSGDNWNYLDNGSDLGATNWKTLNYNDTNWAYGPSPLGYSNVSATTLSYGPDINDKYITYYFRKRLNISNLTSLSDSLILNLRRDDGAVVYINGTEIIRSNLPAGPITYRTNASSIVSGTDEETFYATTVSKNTFLQGDNIIAVELHQRDSSSSDLSFDFTIAEKPNARKACTGANDTHISCFTSLFPTAQGPDFVIPSTHAFQVLIEQGDTYTNTNVRTTVPGNNDFTGYIGRTGSSVDGFLGINHENTPGGFSILDLEYKDSIKLWTVDSSQAVDFYNNDLVTTTRNCSGGITPWGTFITSEETGNAGDANSDGYEDVGWQVEIDPITRKVKEYGTPGKQEKLWALGRMNHENIAVSNDNVTAYEGVDVGSGCLFKFIANNPTDLSSGTLYALKLDSGRASNGEPLSPTGTWIVVPNTTQADQNNSNGLAISLGATTFNGIEDVEIGTIDGKIYFTAKGSNRVYRFNDASTTNVDQFETFVGGQDYLINYGGAVVSEPWASGNDNLCFDDLGNLYVLQDGSRDHVWMVGPSHTQASPKVDIFAKLPSGSEPCGMTFTPDYKFMFLSVQHPSGGNSSTVQIDASGYGADMAKSTTVVIARKEYLGNYAPIAGATNLSFTTNACDSVDLSFNTGSGSGHLVVVKEDSLVSEIPNDGITYQADNTFKVGSDLGQNNFVVYDGLDSNITIKGLEQNTKYHVSIFEYNEAPNKYYLVNTPTTDSAVTAAVVTSAISGNFNSAILASETYTVNNTVGSSYVWDAGLGTITSGQGSNSIQVTWPATPGNSDLKVVETNLSSCEGDTVLANVLFGSVGLESFDLKNSISIAPNPTDGRTTISVVGLDQTIDIVVYDLVGKKVAEERNINNNFELDLSNQNKGTYVLQLTSGNKTATKMLIVK